MIDTDHMNEAEFREFAEQAEAAKPAFYTVAIYLVDLKYGGPEEGGWYYTAGERQDTLVLDGHGWTGENAALPQIFTDRNKAYDAAHELTEKLNASINKGRRPISSVLSTGEYRAEVSDGYPPAYFPETKPHYE
jgi:hypothetical protein